MPNTTARYELMRNCHRCGLKRRPLHPFQPNSNQPLYIEWVCVRCLAVREAEAKQVVKRPARPVKTVLPDERGVFSFKSVARSEGRGGLRITIPARIVRGLVHLGWAGKQLSVRLDGGTQFTAHVRPHPSATMVALPKALRGEVVAGATVGLEVWGGSEG